MRISLVFFLVFYFSSSNAQMVPGSGLSKTDEKVSNKIKELRNSKVDTIICYYITCYGSIRITPDTGCTLDDIKYLLWVKNNNSFIQRFDECNNYSFTNISNELKGYIFSNHVKMKNEKILYPEYDIIVKGKKETYTTLIDHSCHNFVEIYTGTKKFTKDIDDYALETKYVDGKHLNKNYARNRKTTLFNLITLLEKVTKSYDSENKIK